MPLRWVCAMGYEPKHMDCALWRMNNTPRARIKTKILGEKKPLVLKS